ncbi:MAG: hypothetical protein HKN91_09250 [Acidimicrobiia bacterium]|nr:hypothetical protein [Acidimicrobiia bacterium]
MRLRIGWLAAATVLTVLLGACGESRATIEEFCDLNRQINAETANLVLLPPVGEEFEQQRDLVRNLNDRMFSTAPDEIADVADELGPMLTATDADNERVVQLLEVFQVYVAQNCSGGGTR